MLFVVVQVAVVVYVVQEEVAVEDCHQVELMVLLQRDVFVRQVVIGWQPEVLVFWFVIGPAVAVVVVVDCL